MYALMTRILGCGDGFGNLNPRCMQCNCVVFTRDDGSAPQGSEFRNSNAVFALLIPTCNAQFGGKDDFLCHFHPFAAGGHCCVSSGATSTVVVHSAPQLEWRALGCKIEGVGLACRWKCAGCRQPRTRPRSSSTALKNRRCSLLT